MTHNELIKKARQTRQKKGLTQQQVADLLHTTQQQVQRLEAGRSVPTLENFCNYCEAVGLSVSLRKKNENTQDPR